MIDKRNSQQEEGHASEETRSRRWIAIVGLLVIPPALLVAAALTGEGSAGAGNSTPPQLQIPVSSASSSEAAIDAAAPSAAQPALADHDVSDAEAIGSVTALEGCMKSRLGPTGGITFQQGMSADGSEADYQYTVRTPIGQTPPTADAITGTERACQESTGYNAIRAHRRVQIGGSKAALV
jgi:hypothetical protein